MAARRPVLALAEPGGETAQVVTRSGAGIVVPSHDDHAIMEALIAMTTQSQPLTPVNPSEYDGEHRAVQLGRLLLDVVAAASADGARREPPHRAAQQARDNAKPSEVTRV
jgi:hypothetical protein